MVIDNYEGKRILLCNIVIYLGLVIILELFGVLNSHFKSIVIAFKGGYLG